MLRPFLALSLITLLATPAFADTASDQATLDAFYRALKDPVDESAMATLLDDAVTVELRDLGIEQNKAEFLESLGPWADAIMDGSLSYKLTDTANGSYTVEACYRFSSNSLGVSEVFTMTGDSKISTLVQEASDTACGK